MTADTETRTSVPRRDGRVRVAVSLAVALVVLATAAYGWAGWTYAGELLTPVPSSAPTPGPDVLDPGDGPVSWSFEEVAYTSEVGRIPAWSIRPAAPDDTWAIYVHGRGATRADGTRFVPALAEAGLPTLLIGYRNDADAPRDGWYGLGDDEWRDVDGAVAYALEHGARDVVLIGDSMGGAVVANHVRRGQQADVVRGLILDAPALDWHAVLRGQARERGLPEWLVPGALVMSRVRAGIDVAQLDQVAHADAFDVPILLFHGQADDVVPVDGSERFAAAVGDEVTYVEVAGAEHVGSRDVDPDAFDAHVRRFVDRFVD